MFFLILFFVFITNNPMGYSKPYSMQFNATTCVAIAAAKKAGKLLRTGVDTKYTFEEKEGMQNYATEYDKKAEEIIIDYIRSQFPTHNFLAEESGATNYDPSATTWIIDPLDGTTNFKNRLHLFCVSIAAANNNKIVSGVIYIPMLKKLYVAELGKGAFVNGKPLRVSTQGAIEKSFLSVGYPYDLNSYPESLEVTANLQKEGASIRDLGCAAIHCAYVAEGIFDGLYQILLQPWDIAAGKLLIEEAGGKMTLWNGDEVDVTKPSSIVTTNGILDLLPYLPAKK